MIPLALHKRTMSFIQTIESLCISDVYVIEIDTPVRMTSRTSRQFGWYKTTDGQGRSLEVTQPEGSDPALYSEKTTWQACSLQGGTPEF